MPTRILPASIWNSLCPEAPLRRDPLPNSSRSELYHSRCNFKVPAPAPLLSRLRKHTVLASNSPGAPDGVGSLAHASMHPRRPSRGGRQSDAIALRPSPARGLGHEDPEPDEEQARLRQTLAEREHLRTLGEMVLGVAHDLNNTLNAMRLRLEL